MIRNLKKEEAFEIALKLLVDDLKIYKTVKLKMDVVDTFEDDKYWFIFYNSATYLDSGDKKFKLLDTWPVMVSKNDKVARLSKPFEFLKYKNSVK